MTAKEKCILTLWHCGQNSKIEQTGIPLCSVKKITFFSDFTSYKVEICDYLLKSRNKKYDYAFFY